MLPWKHSSTSRTSRNKNHRNQETWIASSLNPANFLPGLVIGFLLGLLVELPKNFGRSANTVSSRPKNKKSVQSDGNEEELKMVFVVRQDLKMGAGKIASQCAHAAIGTYGELMRSRQSLLNKWECCGQPKIVVTCKNQQEMNNLRAAAEKIGLPTFTVADAGRTQVSAGSRTVLAIGPGSKALVDSVTGKLRLL
uniref:peptidyl-tRNA hydrolase n=1 Tax=Araucaria cunninghamii TaxID=56994 RepID=A0A0D6R5J5_ARACU